MKIAVASDHVGFGEKERLKPLLESLEIEVVDLGANSEDPVDYPDFAEMVAESVATGLCDRGILVCGSGTGMAIAANKVPGIRAAVAWNEETASLSRQHNDVNVLAVGARTTPEGQIPSIVRAWLAAEFESGRHEVRIRKISEIEHRESSKQER